MLQVYQVITKILQIVSSVIFLAHKTDFCKDPVRVPHKVARAISAMSMMPYILLEKKTHVKNVHIF